MFEQTDIKNQKILVGEILPFNFFLIFNYYLYIMESIKLIKYFQKEEATFYRLEATF